MYPRFLELLPEIKLSVVDYAIRSDLPRMTDNGAQTHRRRVYPLDAHQLTEEQIAVVFAMTSRRPEAFKEIAQQVSQEKAADFHERWVLGYGHASVAEHAVVHLAVENISRLACDTLEDNRLASYTEKSSRYQVLDRGYYHVPAELGSHPSLKEDYINACNHLFEIYHKSLERTLDFLKTQKEQRPRESEVAYNLRLRREATDSCRAILPAATLTNVGVTANARILEHAISKLLSSELAEEREVGKEIKREGQRITPTLIKYAEENDYLRKTAQRQRELAERVNAPLKPFDGHVRLVHWDEQAEEKLAAALLYRRSHSSYDQVWQRVQTMSKAEREEVIESCMVNLGPHDPLVREFELADYTFEFSLDYGAYREFKRHRMQSYVPQALTVAHGCRAPDLVVEAGLKADFEDAVRKAEDAYWHVHRFSPQVAQYLVTHAHYRRVLSKMNLRECYHLFKLRTSRQAHESIQAPMRDAMEQVRKIHPKLFKYIQLRD
jgi:thymidylate synthase ThyX